MTPDPRLSYFTLWALATLACADDRAGHDPDRRPDTAPAIRPADAGPDAVAEAACHADVAAPAPPRDLPCTPEDCARWGPDQGAAPCPDGWYAEPVVEGTGVVCRPPALARCPRPNATGGCAPVCEDEAPADAVHVAAGGPAGDGSADRPLSDLAAALAGRAEGEVVYLHPGDYAGSFAVPAGVTLRGACPDTVRIVGPADGAALTLGAGAAVERVALRGGDPALSVPLEAAGAPARASDVVIEAASRGIRAEGAVHLQRIVLRRLTGTALVVAGGALEADGLVIADAPIALDATGGVVTLRRALLEDLTAAGLLVQDGARLRLEAVGLERIGAADPEPISVALQALGDFTRVDVDRLAISAPRGIGLLVARGAALAGQRVALREVGDGRSPTRALTAFSRGQVDLDRVTVQGVRGAAIVAVDGQTRIALRRLLVTDVARYQPDDDSLLGDAIVAVSTATIALAEARIARHDGSAVRAYEQASVALEDIVLGPAAVDATAGLGVHATPGERIEVARAVIFGTTDAGVALEGTARVRLADLQVHDVRPGPRTGYGGVGVGVHDTTDAHLERVQVVRARRFGVLLTGATVRAADLDVEDTQEGSDPLSETPDEDALAFGLATADGDVDIDRLRVRDSHFAGVWVATTDAPSTRFAVRDLEVTGSRAGRCEVVRCLDRGGHGLLVQNGADVDVQRARVDDHEGVGVWRECAAALRLAETSLTHSTVGVAAPGACDALEGLTDTCLAENVRDEASVAIEAPRLPD